MLEGTVQTPFGTQSKKTVAVVGAVVVGLGAIVWYRNKDTKLDPSLAGQSEINPATGYPFGSPEDVAAINAQNAYQYPSSVGGGGGGGGGGTSGQQFTSNAQWSQYVITYMSDNDIVADVGPLSAALGKYLAGQPVSIEEASLIQQAIAVAGPVPVSGASGYPPSINTQPAVPPPSGGGGGTTPDTEKPFLNGHVQKNWPVNQWIRDVQRSHGGNPNLNWGLLLQWNPGIAGNVTWHTNSEQNTFKNAATYRINWEGKGGTL